jgi:Tfp pilus assembly protein PilF
MEARFSIVRGVLAAAFNILVSGSAAAQSGRVAGTVKDDKGDPVKGATVRADFVDATLSGFTATTDEKGRWAMVGLRFGEWAFTAGAPGYFGASQNLNVRSAGVNPPLFFTIQKDTTPPSAIGTLAEKDLQIALASADDLYKAQRWDEAIAAYKTILAQSPALTKIQLQIAAAARNKKDYDGAIAAYNELLKADPSNESAKLGIALATFEKGDTARAEQALETASQAPAATREMLFNLGEIKRRKADTAGAAKAYQRAAEIDPFWGKPPLALGHLAMDRGDLTAAARFFQTVLDVDPTSTEAAEATALLQQLKK